MIHYHFDCLQLHRGLGSKSRMTLVPAALVLLLLVLARLLYKRLALRAAERRLDCGAVARPALDPLLGLDLFARSARAAGQRRFLSLWHTRVMGPPGSPATLRVDMTGFPMVWTNEPRNVHAVLATNFADYSVGRLRRGLSRDVLGETGMFNGDGDVWARARALVRPSLTRRQIADLALFERHFAVWMAALDRGGRTVVDIQEWAFRFVSFTSPRQGAKLLCSGLT